MHMARIGYGRTRKELAHVVKSILDEDGRPTPFKNNLPGKDWLNGFFGRHPQLTLRSTLQLGKERAIISPEKINKWFADFTSYIKYDVKDLDILKDPSRLYNADESGFSLCANTGKVIGYKGAPVVYNFGNSSKQQITVMACASASGHFCPPMIVYPGQRFNYEPLEGFEDAHMGRSETGWMDTDLFCNWLSTCFIPALDTRSVKRPVVLFIDGHSTHLSLAASDICVEHGIELYCLLEHSSHVMQPLDLRLFATLKQNWKAAVRAYHVENIGEFLTKRTFARVFKGAWEKSTSIEVAIKGFMEAGLFPICPEQVSKSIKLEPSRMFQGVSDRTPVSGNETPIDVQSSTPSDSLMTDSAVSRIVIPTGDGSNDTTVPSVAALQPSSPCLSEVLTNDDTSVQPVSPATPVQFPLLVSPLSGDLPDSDQAQTDTYVQPPSPVTPIQSPQIKSPLTDVSQTDLPVAVNSPNAANLPSTTCNPPASPFSKYLKYPVVPQKNVKKRKIQPLPKAITGHEYRKLMQEKKELKEKELKEKIRRKEERVQKKMLKEEQTKIKKLQQAERKKVRMEKKRKAAEKMVEDATKSDSDDAAEVIVGKCYKCDQSYGNEFIECENCSRRFHITCVQEEMIDSVPFECKYC